MLKIINPATEQLIAEKSTSSLVDVKHAFRLAVQAQRDWGSCNFRQRAQVICTFRQLLAGEIDAAACTLSAEMGKPVHQAKSEISAALARVDWFLQHTEDVMAVRTVYEQGPLCEQISFDPLGVIANISAWNFPYFVGLNVIIPALLTGSGVLYKPSELTTLTGLTLDRLLQQAGLPVGLFQTLVGGAEVGAYVTQIPVDGMFFTGSVATGMKISAQLGARLLVRNMELGGKDPVYVCEDVDLVPVVEALVDGAFYNAGQSCCSVERIYVHEAIYEDFVVAFVEVASKLQVGDPSDGATYMGPLARRQQMDLLDAQVEDAVQKKAKIVLHGGPRRGPGYFYAPMVLSEVNHDMAVMREESFGPIVGIQKVANDDQAVCHMNDTDMGLTAAVYSCEQARAYNILQQMSSGSVYWNCCDRVSPHLPWSGRKNSGIGATLSTLGVQAFLRPKAWHLRVPN
ncbi:MAG: aldehyde dehydrogenase family protein [Zetaproteobacteria bacterium]|nr:aldehyde dehydrogenase family protein [Zetaproteobacteria bacterium]